MQPVPRSVSCPVCGVRVPWSASSPYRPFCSERCRLIDLGQWASEGYRIAQPQSEPSDQPSDQDD